MGGGVGLLQQQQLMMRGGAHNPHGDTGSLPPGAGGGVLPGGANGAPQGMAAILGMGQGAVGALVHVFWAQQV